ncbi:MAG: hypothetical protein M1823_001798 [Watsoniomyces obsoletus]|nr:MAG: hypothetical protein M1823_001798 [Watsoniomyces obsoletus]
MGRQTERTTAAVPGLIARVGQGRALVSNNFYYYIASNKQPLPANFLIPGEGLHKAKSPVTFDAASGTPTQFPSVTQKEIILAQARSLLSHHSYPSISSDSWDGFENPRYLELSTMAPKGQDTEQDLANSDPQQLSSSDEIPDPGPVEQKVLIMDPKRFPLQPFDVLPSSANGYTDEDVSPFSGTPVKPTKVSSHRTDVLPSSANGYTDEDVSPFSGTPVGPMKVSSHRTASSDHFVPLVQPKPQIAGSRAQCLDHSLEVGNMPKGVPDHPSQLSGPSMQPPLEMFPQMHEKSESQLTEPSPQLPTNPAATPADPHLMAMANAGGIGDREKNPGVKRGMWDYFSIPKRFILQSASAPGAPTAVQEPPKASVESSPKGNVLVTPTPRPESAQVLMVSSKVESVGNESASRPTTPATMDSGVLAQDQVVPILESGSVPDMTLVGQSEDRVSPVPMEAEEITVPEGPSATPIPSAMTEQIPTPETTVPAGPEDAEDLPASSGHELADELPVVSTSGSTETLSELSVASGHLAQPEQQEIPGIEESQRPLEMPDVISGPSPDVSAAPGLVQQPLSISIPAGPGNGDVAAPVEYREVHDVPADSDPGRFFELPASAEYGPPLDIHSSGESLQPLERRISSEGSQWTSSEGSPFVDEADAVTTSWKPATAGGMSGPFSRGTSVETSPAEKVAVLGQGVVGRPEFDRRITGTVLEDIPEHGVPVPREEVIGGGGHNVAFADRPTGLQQRVKSVPGGRPVSHAPIKSTAQTSSSALPVRNLTPGPRARDVLSDTSSDESMKDIETGTPKPSRRRLFLRSARNAAMRPTILKLLVGRQLAGPTKAALRAAAKGEPIPGLNEHGVAVPGA